MARERSATGHLIQELRGLGLTDVQIGRMVGRDSSYIAQAAGPRANPDREGFNYKPAHGLLGPLQEARDRLAASTTGAREEAARVRLEPPRRTTRAGVEAKVRRPATIGGAGWTNTVLKRQASRSGAHGMAYPLHDAGDRQVAATVNVDKGLSVNNSSGGRKRRMGEGGHFTIALGTAEEVAAEVAHQHGGNFTAYVMAQALEAGYISGAADEREAAAHVNAIELRTYE